MTTSTVCYPDDVSAHDMRIFNWQNTRKQVKNIPTLIQFHAYLKIFTVYYANTLTSLLRRNSKQIVKHMYTV